MWVQIPDDSPFDWAAELPDYALKPVPGYYVKGLEGYQIASPENFKQLEKKIEEDPDYLENYGKKIKSPLENIRYNPTTVSRSLRFGQQFTLGTLMVADFYGHSPGANRFSGDLSRPSVSGTYVTLFNVMYFIMNSEVPPHYNNAPMVEGWNHYDIRNYMIECGWPGVKGCMNNLALGINRDFPSQIILQGISGQKWKNKPGKWGKWYESNKNAQLPKKNWEYSLKGQASHIVWRDMLSDRYENANNDFASTTLEIPELATDILLEILDSDNVLARMNAATIVSQSKDPTVQKKVLELIKDKPPLIKYRCLRRLITAGCRKAYDAVVEELKKESVKTFQANYISLLSGSNDASHIDLIINLMKKNKNDENFKEVCLRTLASLCLLDPKILKKIKAVSPRSINSHFYVKFIKALNGSKKHMKDTVSRIQAVAYGPRKWGISTNEPGMTVYISCHQALQILAKQADLSTRKDLWKKFVNNKGRYASTVVRHINFEGLPEKHLKNLVTWAQNPAFNTEFRSACLFKLLELKHPEINEICQKIAEYDSKNVRKDDTNIAHLLVAIGVIGYRGNRKDLEILKEMAGDDRFQSVVRTESFIQLCQNPKDLEEKWIFRLATSDKNTAIRRLAVRALGLLGTLSAKKALCDKLLDQNPSVRFSAAYALSYASTKAHWTDFVSKGKKKLWSNVRKDYLKDLESHQ
jgi:HEAT repeat protein